MAKLLVEAIPGFASELRSLLVNEPDLAVAVNSLRLIDKCRCGDDFCASFYTLPPPAGAWGEGHENVVLEPEDGMIILDVIDRKIGMVEVLYRSDVKEVIERLIH
jgi:hypothetical protein